MNKIKRTSAVGTTWMMPFDELGRAASATFNYDSFPKMLTYTYDAANLE